MGHWKETVVSLFPLSREQPQDATMAEIAAMITDPDSQLAEMTIRARRARQERTAAIRMRNAPAAAFSGTFTSRKPQDLQIPSGLVALEIIHRGGPAPKSPGTLTSAAALAYDSLTLRGTNVIVAVTPAPRDEREQRAAMEAAALHIFMNNPDPESVVHTKRDISSLTLLAHDPDAWVNSEELEPVEWALPQPTPWDQEFNQDLWARAVRMALDNKNTLLRSEMRDEDTEYSDPVWDAGDIRDEATGIYEILLAGPDPDWEMYFGAPPPGTEAGRGRLKPRVSEPVNDYEFPQIRE